MQEKALEGSRKRKQDEDEEEDVMILASPQGESGASGNQLRERGGVINLKAFQVIPGSI